ncbi:hypothetical protein [Coleofasciculus sp. H7-2]|uniref:hypothetical protein n=1 Tax=Coleofasciculus sp. H7-2 TaxID=3351545 RepID=UPI003670A264
MSLIIGEFSRFGGYAGEHQSICSPEGEIDYKTILEECHKHDIGWYAWEWGPGNNFTDRDLRKAYTYSVLVGSIPLWLPPNVVMLRKSCDSLCAVMDIIPDRLFNNLKPGWAIEVALSSPYSIKNTSVTPPTM